MSMSKSSLPAATTSSPLTFQDCTSGTSPTPRRPSLRPARAGSARRLLRLLPLALVALPLGLVGAGCLNPEDAYDSYLNRAEDAAAPPQPVSEASAVDVAALRAPDASFDDTSFVMICLSQVSEVESQALLWKADLKYAVASGGGGTLTFTAQSLAAGATDVNSPLPDSTLGPFDNVSVDDRGVAIVSIPSAVLPQAANSITGTQLTLEQITIALHIESPTQICANLGANVTQPTPLTLNPPQNPCIFLPTDKNGRWGTVTTDQIHCP
jgi:hypothetical protein